MNKLTFILMMTLCLTFTACYKDYNTESIQNVSTGNGYIVDKVKVDNHDYIVAKTKTIAGYVKGISIIHSESCECKKRK